MSTTTILRGPADADHYRVQVGRYGDRWYHDPLPADDTWPAWDGSVPSISIVKKASGSDWSFVATKRIATAGPDRLRQIAELPTTGERVDALNSINKRGLEAASSRGTGIHSYCEALLNGTSTEMIPSGPWQEYRAAVDRFFDQYQPELVAAEYVVIHRGLHGVGYGGTPDGLVRIDGQLWAIDWKSRGEDSAHGAYAEEADQIAAGVLADYMIVEGPNGPERRPIPDVDGGLIISIKPDGCRPYPIDVLRTTWVERHAWWCARRTERDAIGKPWAPRKTTTAEPTRQADVAVPGEPERRQNLRARCQQIADSDPAAGAILRDALIARALTVDTATTSQLDDIELLVQQGERAVSAPFQDLAVPLDEGPILADNDPRLIDAQRAFLGLDNQQQAIVLAVVDNAGTLSLRTARTLRRALILHALSILAADNVADHSVIRAIVYAAGAPDRALDHALPVAEAVALCDAGTAARAVTVAGQFHDGHLVADFTEAGHLVLHPEATPTATQQRSIT